MFDVIVFNCFEHSVFAFYRFPLSELYYFLFLICAILVWLSHFNF